MKYNSDKTSTAKIEQSVAAVGYDTKNFKASNESYDKLDDCCKYERTSSNEAKADCCKDEKCADCKEGKCKEMSACKESKCEHHDGANGTHSCCKKA